MNRTCQIKATILYSMQAFVGISKEYIYKTHFLFVCAFTDHLGTYCCELGYTFFQKCEGVWFLPHALSSKTLYLPNLSIKDLCTVLGNLETNKLNPFRRIILIADDVLIGLLSLVQFPKLFERLVTQRITHFITSIFSPHQRGFVKGRSTLTNILELVCHVPTGFSNKLPTDIIYTDFSKAFDTVVRNLLIYKRDSMGFSSTHLKWILSYLRSWYPKSFF